MPFPVRSAAILAIRRRADMVNNQFVTDDELIDLANDNLEFVYRECVTAYGESVFLRESIFNISSGSSTAGTWPATVGGSISATRYPLPTDFLRLIRAEWSEGVGSQVGDVWTISGQTQPIWYAMRPIDPVRLPRITESRTWVGQEPAYWITGNMGPAVLTELNSLTATFFISFWPFPATAVCVHLFYLPACPRYGSADNSVFINLNQLAWQYVRETTAAQLLEKQDRDASALRAASTAALVAIREEQQQVDTNPRGTIDVYGYDGPRDELYEWR
jgi:hypothetical protein